MGASAAHGKLWFTRTTSLSTGLPIASKLCMFFTLGRSIRSRVACALHAHAAYTQRRSLRAAVLFLGAGRRVVDRPSRVLRVQTGRRSEEHTSELQSPLKLVC